MSIFNNVENRIKKQFINDSTGHDWFHVQRVLKMSRHLQQKEGGNLEIIELAALLHDISDYKFNGGDLTHGGIVSSTILKEEGANDEIIKQVKYIVDNVSYKGDRTPSSMDSLEGEIVQDADRLDAIGAIGISRVFAYGGNKGQPIYNPKLQPLSHSSFQEYAFTETTSINHFYEKLLLLKDRLNTRTAKIIGTERHKFIENYLDQFYKEWNLNFEE